MEKFYKRSMGLTLLMLLAATIAFAQTTVSGTVKDATTSEGLAGVNIVVKGKVQGTITNTRGEFTLNVNQEPPLTLIFSFVGYKTQEIEVTEQNTADLNIILEESYLLGQEIVVSASKVEESILQAPVSIEKMDILAIKSTPSLSFYDALGNMKGVDLATQSLTFRSVNTRGFGANGNTRFVQLIDGMDNQAPGLNFSVGNIVGISELDLESVELIPGAASALYGPNALTGLLLMNSKSPFQYQGVSAYMKTGIMNESTRSEASTGFIDFGVRYAKSFNNKFAIKANFSYLKADDWQANDFRDQSLLNGNNLETGTREGNPAFNGVNIYGDETNVNMYSSLFANGTPGDGSGGTSAFLGFIATNPIPAAGNQTLPQVTGLTPQQLFAQLFPSTQNSSISRIGYEEKDLADYGTKSLKTNLAMHYRFTDKIEGILQGNYGSGTSVYTGADRYSLKDFYLYQIKAELRGDNFFLRGYTTQERSGDAYAIGTLAQLVNEAWKPSQQWYPQYFQTFGGASYQTYATAYLTALGGGADAATAQAAALGAVSSNFGTFHNAARSTADNGRLIPGTPEFNQTVEQIKKGPIPQGARFVDKTNLYHYEGMYNFKNQIDFMEIIVGGNYRVYDLNSEGTLFATDDDGNEFNIKEYGAYLQAAKRFFNDNFKLTGSMRYDKNENFKGQFSPRVTGVYTIANNHNLRASYQTGFRIPTTQDQYIDLLTPQARLIGGLPLFRSKYDLQGAFTLESVLSGSPELYEFSEFKPERALVYEFGYKGLIANKLLVDAYYYSTTYKDFIGGQVIVKNPGTLSQQVFSLPDNLSEDLKAHGWALGLDYSLPKGFTIGGNVAFNKLTNEDELPDGFQAAYNTPEYRYNISFGYREHNKNLGFNIVWRHQDSYLWQSSFVGPAVRVQEQSIMPEFSTLDAQVSYKVKSLKSIIKIGGSNILNEAYQSNWGNPTVGALYYISISFDEFLN